MPDPSSTAGPGQGESKPDWSTDIRARLSALSIAPSREAEIVEELTQHLDDRWHELIASGEPPDEAARIARTELTSGRLITLLSSLHQAHWREIPPPGPAPAFSLDSLATDLRHAIRALVATPSFTIGALLVLAMGTGATTAIFSVVDAVALRPLPFSDPDRVVAIGEVAMAGAGRPVGPTKGGAAPVRAPKSPTAGMPGAKPADPDALGRIEPQNYLDWAAQQRVFESIAPVADAGEYTLEQSAGEQGVVVGHRVTASFFDVLRSRPMMGETFTSKHEVIASDRVVVLSHAFWQRRFGSDPSVVGRMLTLNGESYEVLGVMPAGFSYPPGAAQPAEIWVPWVPTPQERVRGGGRSIYLQGVARLKPGISLAQAQAQMSQVAETIAAANPATNTGRGIGVRPPTRARVIADVVGHAGWLVTGGLVVGGFAAWSLSNLAGRFLFGLDPRDARAYGVAMATLVAAALIATVLPARRAASIDPTEALRRE